MPEAKSRVWRATDGEKGWEGVLPFLVEHRATPWPLSMGRQTGPPIFIVGGERAHEHRYNDANRNALLPLCSNGNERAALSPHKVYSIGHLECLP